MQELDKLKFITASVSDLVITHNRGIITSVNDAGLKATGYSPEEVIGKQVLQFIADEDKQVITSALQQREQGLTDRLSYHVRIIKKDGTMLPLEVSSFTFLAGGAIEESIVICKDVSEKVAIQADFNEVERLFKIVAENIQDGVFKIENMRISYTNDRLEQIFGYSLEELQRIPVERLLVPEDSLHLLEAIQRVLSGQDARGDIAGWILSKDGTRKYVKVNYMAMPGKSTVPVIFGTVSDATWHARVDEFLAVQLDLAFKLGSTADLGEILEFSLDAAMTLGSMDCGGVYLVKRNGDMQLACHKGLSDAFVRAVSYYKADSKNVGILNQGEAFSTRPDPATPSHRIYIEEGLACIVVIPILHEGRPIACINLGSHRLHDLPGDSRNLLFLTCAQASSAIARAKAESQYHLLADTAQDLIVIHDADGMVEFANELALKILGCSREEIMTRSIYSFIPAPVHEAVKDIMAKRVAGDFSRIIFTHDIVVSGGKRIPMELSSSPIVSDGRLSAVLVIGRDITERREMDRVKNAFVSNATHELKTPLSTIAGAARFLQSSFQDQLPAGAGRMVDLIARGSDRLQELVDKMLDFSRLERGKIALQLDTADAFELLADVARDMSYLASQKSITIVNSCTEPGLSFSCDKKRVEQVLVNLVSNAIKNSKAGTTVRLSARDGEASVVFVVQDEGIGITHDEMKTLFTEFGKIERAHEDVDIQGTGLGLYISKGIAELHGGTITAESPGRHAGATFTVTLPKRPVPRAAVTGT